MTTASNARSAAKPKRSTTGPPASGPTNGRNGMPAKLEMEVIAPSHTATSAAGTPMLGRYSGVNALTCPNAQTSHRPAIEKSPTMRTQPDGVFLRKLAAFPRGAGMVSTGIDSTASGEAKRKRDGGGRHVLEPHLQDREGEALC